MITLIHVRRIVIT